MKQSLLIIVLGLLSSSYHAFGFADTDNTAPTSPISAAVLLEIDGVKLTLADFGRKHPGGLFQASQNFYQAERKVMESWVDEYLLERAAQKENITVAELLDRHINVVASKDPPEEAIRVYYDGIDTDQPYEALRPQIITHLREGRLTKAKAAYMKSLHSQAHISLQFGAPRAPISLKDTPIRGSADAPVVIVEYADYECPYCQQVQAAVDQIEAEYKGKIAFVYKDMPLPNHGHAQKAAEASHCAAVQGKYWEYHDVLLKTKAMDIPDLKAHARALKLDADAFDKCVDSGAQAEVVKAQFTEGVGFGLQGTPGFFINGHVYAGVLNAAQFREAIGQELATATAQGQQTAKR
jgi:protein-disulfide isomerase